MPKVKYDPPSDVTCELVAEGATTSTDLSVSWRTQIGTDFDGDGKLDAGSVTNGPMQHAMSASLGKGADLHDHVIDVIVLFHHNPKSTVTKLTVSLTQNGQKLGGKTRDVPAAEAPGPILVRFWD